MVTNNFFYSLIIQHDEVMFVALHATIMQMSRKFLKVIFHVPANPISKDIIHNKKII